MLVGLEIKGTIQVFISVTGLCLPSYSKIKTRSELRDIHFNEQVGLPMKSDISSMTSYFDLSFSF